MRHSRLGNIKKSHSTSLRPSLRLTKHILLGELIQRYPEAAEVLIEEYGLHCVGCGMAGYESLADGLAVHGFDKKETEKVVKKLNQIIKKKRRGE